MTEPLAFLRWDRWHSGAHHFLDYRYGYCGEGRKPLRESAHPAIRSDDRQVSFAKERSQLLTDNYSDATPVPKEERETGNHFMSADSRRIRQRTHSLRKSSDPSSQSVRTEARSRSRLTIAHTGQKQSRGCPQPDCLRS